MSERKHHFHITRKLMSLCTVMYVFMMWSMLQVALAHRKAGLTNFQAPQNFVVKNVDKNSFTLTWKRPALSGDKNTQLLAFSLSYTSVNGRSQGKPKYLLLPPTSKLKTLTGLSGGTRYEVSVSAVYSGSQRVSAPKKIVNTKTTSMGNFAMDDGDKYEVKPKELECNCSEPGMVACTRMHETIECTCYPGYTGRWCESCSSGHYRDEKECKPCPCVNVTSSGNCTLDKAGEVTCTSCLLGHRGLLCDACMTGYHWQEDQCVPLNCLSFSVCAEQQDDPDCSDCIFLTRSLTPPTAQKGFAPTIADGTIPLIAVIVTLGVILLVAGTATCYRYWSYRRSRPRLPFWSIELREEKLNLSSEYQYQHLDAATSKDIQAITTDDVEPDNLVTPQPSLTSFKKCYKTMDI